MGIVVHFLCLYWSLIWVKKAFQLFAGSIKVKLVLKSQTIGQSL